MHFNSIFHNTTILDISKEQSGGILSRTYRLSSGKLRAPWKNGVYNEWCRRFRKFQHWNLSVSLRS